MKRKLLYVNALTHHKSLAILSHVLDLIRTWTFSDDVRRNDQVQAQPNRKTIFSTLIKRNCVVSFAQCLSSLVCLWVYYNRHFSWPLASFTYPHQPLYPTHSSPLMDPLKQSTLSLHTGKAFIKPL